MRKKFNQSFCTIVTHAEDLELRKDPGQIPYQLGRLPGMHTRLVSYYYGQGGRNAGPAISLPEGKLPLAADYPSWFTDVQGLKIDFLPYKGRGRFYERSVLSYLAKNAGRIDILNLFHFSAENIFYVFFYKLLHPSGKVFLKLDIDIAYYHSRAYFFNTGGTLALFRGFVFERLIQPLFFRLVHTISAESQAGLEYFSGRFKVKRSKMIVLPNGVDDLRIAEKGIVRRLGEEKENLLITVGRIGVRQKNNEMLLGALSMIGLNGWQVAFIGPVEESFQPVIRRFFTQNPDKIPSVTFTGKLDAESLYGYYSRAKIFCLTSANEGFPLAACEAAYFGNYLILSDRIACFDELTDSGKFGERAPFDDFTGLAERISALTGGTLVSKTHTAGMQRFADQHLTWRSLLPKLSKRLLNS